MSATRPASAGPRDVPAELAGRTVVVLAGGRSGEREVSLRSGRAVADALAGAVGEGGLAALREVDLGEDGRWNIDGDGRDPAALDPAAALVALPADAVYFLALHGGDGEDGGVQGFLECAGRAHTGSGVGASALAMDKAATRALLAAAGVPVAPGRLVQAWQWRDDADAVLADLAALSSTGWFVKPNHGGSSVHTFRVERADDLRGAVEEVLATGDGALVEARVDGIEATCGVIGSRDDARTLPPVEILPRDGAFFDYAQKYDDDGAEEVCPPRTLGREVCDALARHAAAAHRVLGCEGYSRTDFIVPPGGAPVALELNTLPGLTARSLTPQAAAATGLGFPGLCLEILRLAVTADRSRRR